MKQEYELGKFLKNRYVTKYNLLNSSYLLKEVNKFYKTFNYPPFLNTIWPKLLKTMGVNKGKCPKPFWQGL